VIRQPGERCRCGRHLLAGVHSDQRHEEGNQDDCDGNDDRAQPVREEQSRADEDRDDRGAGDRRQYRPVVIVELVEPVGAEDSCGADARCSVIQQAPGEIAPERLFRVHRRARRKSASGPGDCGTKHGTHDAQRDRLMPGIGAGNNGCNAVRHGLCHDDEGERPADGQQSKTVDRLPSAGPQTRLTGGCRHPQFHLPTFIY
jgi:hypothetical protein